jgi:chromosome segregation ATPase
MAEIFAAVASGAGLVSLAIQLLESSQKLKSLYNATKDAPRNVKDLCFDLETLSLQLRQLEQHRQHDHLDTELLDRCIAQCERRTEKVSDVVEDMTRYIQRSVTFGRLYVALKEPEVEKLLDELERTKSSLSLTYISYCQ